MKNCLLLLLIFLIVIFCFICALALPSAHDADIRNRYFKELDYQFLKKEFSKKNVRFYDALGDYNGLYGGINLYVNDSCTIPDEVINYFKKYKFGRLMRIQLIQGPPGTNEVIESRFICF